MAKRRTEIVAASLLETWTDSDTAMQIVGSSLGIFGTGLLDPTRALSDETPLRNALFDVLLSLVEGGALEMRPTDDGRYAFRWRADIATAGLSGDDAPSIDIAVPSPFAVELTQARAERDEALGRADFAEALAAERERLLRVAGIRGPNESAAPPKPRPAKPAARRTATAKPAAPAAAPKKPRKAKPNVAADAEPAAGGSKAPGEPRESSGVVYLPSSIPHAQPDAEPETESHEPTDSAQTAGRPPRHKWSGYAIDTPRPHLSGVERLVDEA